MSIKEEEKFTKLIKKYLEAEEKKIKKLLKEYREEADFINHLYEKKDQCHGSAHEREYTYNLMREFSKYKNINNEYI